MDDAIMALEHVRNIRQGNERYLRMTLQFSARNQLRARVKSVKLGTVMAEVIVELSDGQQIASAITRTSAEGLNLQSGDDVLVIIKSTEVMIGKDV
jgi:molybdopterin-binding protein